MLLNIFVETNHDTVFYIFLWIVDGKKKTFKKNRIYFKYKYFLAILKCGLSLLINWMPSFKKYVFYYI